MQKSPMKAVGAGAATLMLAVALASCSGGAQPSAQPTTPGGSASGSPTLGGTLDVMMSPHALTDQVQNSLPEFESKTGIKVNITSLNEDQVSQQLRVEFGAANT